MVGRKRQGEGGDPYLRRESSRNQQLLLLLLLLRREAHPPLPAPPSKHDRYDR